MVARALALSARDHPAGGYRTTVGFGLINPAGALREAGLLRGMRTVAAPGRGVAGPSSRLLPAEVPGVAAGGQSVLTAAGPAVEFGAGVALIVAAFGVRARWRPRARRARPRRA